VTVNAGTLSQRSILLAGGNHRIGAVLLLTSQHALLWINALVNDHVSGRQATSCDTLFSS
jgi:hypothetical protein